MKAITCCTLGSIFPSRSVAIALTTRVNPPHGKSEEDLPQREMTASERPLKLINIEADKLREVNRSETL
jgi:hypothetical protein